MKQSSRLPWILGAVGGAVLILITAIVVVFLFQHQDEAHWEYAYQRITQEVADPQERQFILVLARSLHNRAMNQSASADLRGRKRYLQTTKEEYFESLMEMVRRAREELEEKTTPSAAHLSDFWERVDNDQEIRYVTRLYPDGRYHQVVFTTGSTKIAVDRSSGTWDIQGDRLVWYYRGKEDPNPFLKLSRRAFVLRETDGRLTYWKRILPTASIRKEFGE